MTKILITGANGQLGSELRNLLDERGVAYDAFDSNQMDITDQAVVNEKISAPLITLKMLPKTSIGK